MRRQRGFLEGPLLYLVLGIAMLGALAGLVGIWKSYTNGIDRKGYERGKAEITAKWEAADRQATENAAKDRQALQGKVDELTAKHGQALDLALSYHDDWEKEKNDARRAKKPLTTATCPGGNAGPERTAPGDPDVRLTWLFVRTYDAAWTGPDGKPLYPDTGEPAPAAGQTGTAGSPYSIDDLLDTHGKNAERYNACVRDYTALISTVLKLKADWGTAALGTLPATP